MGSQLLWLQVIFRLQPLSNLAILARRCQLYLITEDKGTCAGHCALIERTSGSIEAVALELIY